MSVTTKGSGASLVIIDEAAYINKQLYDETIRALTNVRDNGLIAISTPLGPDNFVSQLIDMKNEDGSDFHNVLHLTTICEQCALLPSKSEQAQCRHTFLPQWKSRDKQARNARVGSATGSMAITMQEDCGIITSGSNNTIFSPDQLKRIFNRNDKNRIFASSLSSYTPERIYVFCDPNADGSSNTAIFSCYWAPPPTPMMVKRKNSDEYKPSFQMPYPLFVILGVDVCQTQSGSQKDSMVLNHMKHIRTKMNPKFSEIPIIYVPEQGTGSEASRGEDTVRNLPTVVCLKESGGPKFGVRKTSSVTADYVNTWQTLMDNDQIRWDENLFTLSNEYVQHIRTTTYDKKTSDADIVLGGCKAELTRMKYIKKKITGKGESNSFNDDMAVCIMMASYWSKAVENENAECYKPYRNLKWVDLVTVDKNGNKKGGVSLDIHTHMRNINQQ